MIQNLLKAGMASVPRCVGFAGAAGALAQLIGKVQSDKMPDMVNTYAEPIGKFAQSLAAGMLFGKLAQTALRAKNAIGYGFATVGVALVAAPALECLASRQKTGEKDQKKQNWADKWVGTFETAAKYGDYAAKAANLLAAGYTAWGFRAIPAKAAIPALCGVSTLAVYAPDAKEKLCTAKTTPAA